MVKAVKDQAQLHSKLMSNHISQLHKQLSFVENQLVGLDIIRKGVSGLKCHSVGDKILAPLSEGIFLNTKFSKKDSFLVNVGANIVVEKSSDQVKFLLDNQFKELISFQKDIMNNLYLLNSQIEGTNNL